ncbi:hypothetical protein B0H14DRAFT_3443623 [Mycena olivaceomarginata]|nr:hypothetical protein B0H14DRAFT_3443623 [Mycena olivaceomarginata]
MASLFTSVTTKHSVHPRQPAPPPVVLPSLLTPIACFDFPLPFALTNIDPANGASELLERAKSERALTPVQAPTPARAPTPAQAPTPARGLTPAQERARSERARTASPVPPTRHDSPLTDVEDESQYLKPRPIFVSNIKAFFSADSDYESFKKRINEVAAQHLEMERYLDHQDEDAKKKVFDKLTIDYPFLKKCPECWPVAFSLQMKLHNNTNRANKRASAEAIATLKSIAPGGGPSRRVKSTTMTTTSGRRGQKRTRASSNAAPHVTFEERA